MKPTLLLEHFERIAEAPDSISHLRRFVLSLAITGKLTEQDTSDGSASGLLDDIHRDKARLITEGLAKKGKAIVEHDSESIPFEIPANWAWSQLLEIGFISPRNDAPDDAQASFVPMTMIPADYGAPHSQEVRAWREIKKGYTHFADGDVGLAKITPCFENGKSTVFRNLCGGIGAGTTELHIVRPVHVSADYILIFLKSSHFIGSGVPKMTGTAGQKRVPSDYFARTPFPLPPLAEQHRIVAKVDELMGLFDQLEAAQNKREARRDRLVTASLHRIQNPEVAGSEDETAEEAWSERDFLKSLPILTWRPEYIEALRSLILNLAARGRLVPQVPDDEPASELLDRAISSKANLMSDRAIRRAGKAELSESEGEVYSPSSWRWIHLYEIALVQGGKRLPAGSTFSNEPTGNIYIRVTDMKDGTISLSNLKHISDDVRAKIAKYTINKEDLYITIAGTIGAVGNVPDQLDGQNLTENAAKIVFRELNKDFLQIVLCSDDAQRQFREKTIQMAQPKLALKRIAGVHIPVPPLAEQRRIVAKVNELMALCDQLETNLRKRQSNASKLMETVLQEAV